jgi:hypothetical protein
LIMRLMCSMVLTLIFVCGQVLAAPANPSKSKLNQGIFTSVNGKVQIKSKSGNKTREAKKDSTVLEGERITTGKDSSAVLRLFDGSELKVSSKTEFWLSKLQTPSVKDKVLKFKLAFGQLAAKVKKLASSKSSFEIEAGGVVCGVRGTEYTYSYDPVTNKVTVKVLEGTVFMNSGGQTYLFTAGQTIEFNNGQPSPNNPPQTSNQGKNTNKQDPSGGDKGGTSSLADLNQQFGDGLSVNGDNSFTDPAVEGSVKLNVRVNVAPGETVP